MADRGCEDVKQGDVRMIARRWHGRVPAAKAEQYLKLMKDVGLADYRSAEGNRGAWCLHRREQDVVHVEMLTLWDDLDAIRRFAGDEHAKAKYYDFDPDYLLELEPEVTHLEVIEP
jgi:heme-degrading monooxygenase HmoA